MRGEKGKWTRELAEKRSHPREWDESTGGGGGGQRGQRNKSVNKDEGRDEENQGS